MTDTSANTTGPQKLSRQEAHDLGQIIKDRAKVLEASVDEQVAAQMADFERQISTEYKFDQDAVWEQAARDSARVVTEANDKIVEQCKKLGIPMAFAPKIELTWANRGQNMMASRRTELRTAATKAVEAMKRAAITRIRKQSLDLRTQVVSAGMLSADGKLFLESLAPIEESMQSLSFREIAQRLEADKKKRRLADAMLYGPGTRFDNPMLGYDGDEDA